MISKTVMLTNETHPIPPHQVSITSGIRHYIQDRADYLN